MFIANWKKYEFSKCYRRIGRGILIDENALVAWLEARKTRKALIREKQTQFEEEKTALGYGFYDGNKT